MLGAALLVGCSDDDLAGPAAGQYTDKVCFSTIAPAFEPDTRSGANAQAGDCFMLRSGTGGDSLFVNVSVCGFDDPSTRASLATSESIETMGVSALASKAGSGKWVTFFDLEQNEKQGATGSQPWSYTSNNVYYWPGNDFKMKFCAYSPYSCQNLTYNYAQTSGGYPSLDYMVPDDINRQTDLLAVKTAEVPGDYNAAVPLAFNHICTAVQFREGADMQPGTINKVELLGVKYRGEFSFDTMSWTTDAAQVHDFEHNFGKDMAMQEGAAITDDSACFVMLPQTLPEGARLRVTFRDKVTGQDRVMTASLAGKTWPQGKKVAYTISITPDYNLEFVSEPEVQDAHYVVYPIKIKLDKALPGGWTLTSNDPANVTFVETFDIPDIKRLVDAGYWLDGYNGSSKLSSTTTGEVTVYVFLTENVTQEDREITLSLYPTAVDNDDKAKEKNAKKFTFTQYCPAWNGGLGVERIQDADYPWGFNWNYKIEVKFTPSSLGDLIGNLLVGLYVRWSGLSEYVKETSNWWQATKTFEIDYSKISALPNNVAISDDNGQANTWELRSSTGASDVAALLEQLEGWGGEVQGNMDYALDFAARACAMKNKFRVEATTESGRTVYRPVLDESNLVWYLPSRNEALSMKDNLSGEYWTSTAITNPGTTAYKYTAGGSTSPHNRGIYLHVRAVRKQGTAAAPPRRR